MRLLFDELISKNDCLSQGGFIHDMFGSPLQKYILDWVSPDIDSELFSLTIDDFFWIHNYYNECIRLL